MVVPWLMPGIAIPGPWLEGQEPTGSSMQAMAAHSTAWAAGCAQRAALARRPGRVACQANHAAAAANTARQAVTGTGVSRGSSIPAMATPIRTCSASASRSVFLPRSRETARRVAQKTAIMIMRTAKLPASQGGALTSAPPGPGVPGMPAAGAWPPAAAGADSCPRAWPGGLVRAAAKSLDPGSPSPCAGPPADDATRPPPGGSTTAHGSSPQPGRLTRHGQEEGNACNREPVSSTPH